MNDHVKAALRRALRVFIAGALVGGIAALRGDVDFVNFLKDYAVEVALVVAVAKYLRDKYDLKWLPL